MAKNREGPGDAWAFGVGVSDRVAYTCGRNGSRFATAETQDDA
jgi:hypothetical protein